MNAGKLEMSFLSLVRRPIPGIKGLIPVILELPR